MRFVQLQHLGQHLAYAPIWAYQEELLQQNLERKKQGIATLNTLLLLQHSPVYTLGKSGKASNILISEEERAGQGIEYFHINRGGDVTFHGPGQLVGYPILDLELFKPDLGWYLRTLEQCFIDVLVQYGIEAGRSKGETGVWIDADKPGKERKICAMGIRCSRWITMHGFAFNVNTNLHYFSQIVPCGIADKQVTSLANELGQPQDEGLFTERFLVAFAQNFEVEFREEVSKFSAPENA